MSMHIGKEPMSLAASASRLVIANQPVIANVVKQSMASHALTNDGSPRRSAPRDDEMNENLSEQNLRGQII